MEPLIQYATTSDGVSIAFWALGTGPTLVVLPALPLSHLQVEWRLPAWRSWIERLAETHRVVRYDSRGTGLSDRDPGDMSLGAHLLDLDAVLAKTAEGEAVSLLAISYAGPIALSYAARRPASVARLMLWCTHASIADVVARITTGQAGQRQAVESLASVDWDLYIRTYLHRAVGWNEGEHANQFAELARQSIDPRDFLDALRAYESFDAREDLPNVMAPTLILHRPGFPGSSVEVAKGLAGRIQNSRLSLFEGASVAPFIGDAEPPLRAIEGFLGVERAGTAAPDLPAERVAGGLRTILCTDIAGHTAMMRRRGDALGRDVLRYHEDVTRAALKRFGGDEVKSLGDGFLASFGSAHRALECAVALQRAFDEELPGGERIAIRVGINAGEPIEENDDLFGTAVIAASRIAGSAEGGQVLVSMVVRELVAGKRWPFVDRGTVEMRGFDEPVRVYELDWRATPSSVA